MPRKRVMLNVIVDLDPMPGTFSTTESAVESVASILLGRIGHYNPVVFAANEVEEVPAAQPQLPMTFTCDYVLCSGQHPSEENYCSVSRRIEGPVGYDIQPMPQWEKDLLNEVYTNIASGKGRR